MDRRMIPGSLQKRFLVRWVGEAQSDSWHDIDAFIWRPEDLEALSRREGFARLEDDAWYPVGLNTTEGTIASILRQKGAAAEEARAVAEAKAAELVAARAAKDKHQLANMHDVVPMVMERGQVRKEAEEAKAAAEARAAEQARAAAEARAAEDAALRQQIGAKKKLALQLRATDKPAAIQALREALREAKQLEATLKARLEARAAEEEDDDEEEDEEDEEAPPDARELDLWLLESQVPGCTRATAAYAYDQADGDVARALTLLEEARDPNVP
jgi:hypothetical protein